LGEAVKIPYVAIVTALFKGVIQSSNVLMAEINANVDSDDGLWNGNQGEEM
jgi:hypothetical protein